MTNCEKLRQAGFSLDEKTEGWFSRRMRKKFSLQAIRDGSEKSFDECLREKLDDGLFVFYLLHHPSDSTFCEKELSKMELTDLRPEIRLVKPRQGYVFT
jgi:hypothetical protein